MDWRIIIDGKRSPSENMAIDEAIMIGMAKNISLPTIRFYDWNPPTASFGYNQKIIKEADLSILNEKGYGYVKRPTGGRMVLHKNEVTYAVIAPLKESFSGNISESYTRISLALAQGLQNMGLSVEFEKGTLSASQQRQAVNPCFTSSSRYELKYKGKKIVGSAQVRKNGVFLQHGAILLDQNQAEVAYLLPGLSEEQRKKLAAFLTKKTTCINSEITTNIGYQEAVKNLIEGFKQAWKGDKFSFEVNYNPKEIDLIKELEIKYKSDKWNLDR